MASPTTIDDRRPAAPEARGAGRPAHLPALDGLRGVAVTTVVAFHAHWLTGGYLGVDLFFVLSGFLITRLLLDEKSRTGRIDLRRFWVRRARRLLPAMLTVVAVAAIVERWRERLDGPAGGRRDVLGALTYSTNWLRLSARAGYWRQFGGPSVLDHMWSLAIEEQFYVVWPLVVLLLCTVIRARLGRVFVLGALSAAGALWALGAFARWHDANRVYLGTDTRAVALLLGATVAAVAAWRPLPRSAPMAIATAGAAATVIVSMFRLRGDALITYRGGLLANSVAGAVLIAAAANGRPWRAFGPLTRGPLVWLGERSYGIYLWHWPLMVAFGVAGSPQSASWRRVASIAVTLLVAEVSYRLVEQPIRRHGLRAFGRPLLALAPAATLLAVAVLAVAAPTRDGGPSAAAIPLPLPAASPASTLTPAAAAPSAAPPSTSTDEPAATAATAAAPIVRRPLPADRPPRVMYVGDSVGWYLGGQAADDASRLAIVADDLGEPECPLADGPLQRRRDPGSVPIVFDRRCSELVADYAAIVAERRPDVVIMAFGATLFEQNEIAPGVWATPCQPAFDTWFAGQVARSAAALSSAGASVYWASAAYYRAEVNKHTTELDDQIDCLNAVARSVAAASDGALSILPLGEWTCPTRECLTERDGFTLRSDGTHYRDAGAALANAWMLGQIFETPPWQVPREQTPPGA